jgi:hypothetical protein
MSEAKETSELIDVAMSHLQSSNFQDAINEAVRILEQRPPRITIGACHWIIGCAMRELGRTASALTHLLEATTILSDENSAELVGHAQSELSRTLYELNSFNAAQFFIRMAILNFESLGLVEMSENCKKFEKSIQQKI